jgi:hypothetical protein
MIILIDSIDGKGCNSCGSTDDVKEMYIGTTTHGTTVKLCSKCRNELLGALTIEKKMSEEEHIK